MYGTTETQRAVSYYELPSRHEDPEFLDKMGDVIPAGKGMNNVQLLVVDRTSLEKSEPRLCPVGEIGEVFVRAGGAGGGLSGFRPKCAEVHAQFLSPRPRDLAKEGQRKYSADWQKGAMARFLERPEG